MKELPSDGYIRKMFGAESHIKCHITLSKQTVLLMGEIKITISSEYTCIVPFLFKITGKHTLNWYSGMLGTF